MTGKQDAERVLLDIGLRVAELRAERGWTQEQLAETADFSTQYLQRIEAGGENLTVRSLVNLAGLFGVEVAALFIPPRNRDPRRVGRPRTR